MGMPILIYNIGSEMIYILCSRLKAQNIAEEKAVKVINDVVINLFDKQFMEAMKKKQEMSKHLSVRQLFDKLAHSSIMKLNASSMSKLFDLMLMSFKFQLLRTKFAEEIIQITLNHLHSVREILLSQNAEMNKDALQLLKDNITYINTTYKAMSSYEFILLKQTLLRFFQVLLL